MHKPDRRQAQSSETPRPTHGAARFHPLRLIRIASAGVLMGTANLIPGVSGGTMVLAMGIYQEFIDSVADVTALRLSVRRVVFLGVLGGCAVAAIVALAKLILFLLFHYPIGMYSLFIGLTLGGAPIIMRSLRPVRADAILTTFVGVALMAGILFLRAGGGFPHNTAMDVVSGLIGATTMVLPGVSGSYMLLILDQYERVVGSVDDFADAARALAQGGTWSALWQPLKIIIPVGLGAVAGVIGLSHLLKVLLHRFPRPTLGVLLGILLGSIIGLWPFGKQPGVKALERRDVAELRRFADVWQIPGIVDLDDGTRDEQNKERIIQAIDRNWIERGRSGYSTQQIATAFIAIAVGFAVTFAMARRRTPEEHEPPTRMTP